MKKVFKTILKVVEVIVILYVIFMSTCLLCRNKYGYTKFSEKTIISMGEKDTKYLKNFSKSDLLVIKEVDPDDVKVGEKLYYYSVENEKYIIKLGEVSDKNSKDGTALYKFKDEKDISISSSKIIGTFEKKYANVGGVLTFLESRIGFLIFVLLPILLLFIYEIYDLVVSVKYEEDDTPKKKINKKSKNKKEEEIETL